MIGNTLAHFKITAKLGEGGMGEVYRAEDTKLGREVAIKVLPVEVAEDPERLARFEREARAVAALSHPNILAIYDFGSENGVTYAVMELLDGQTLREVLQDGPLPTRKALEYARQVANGLGAAHDKGVAHRDLKPENLIVTRKGRVKILDFGLAKWTPLEEGAEDPTLAETFAAETGPGMVLGTVGYMSPEQVRGQSADHRADVFSLGAILYEMLSGGRAFQADSAVETMSAILKEHPPELSKTVENLPPSVDRIVQHCLEKDPEQRFQSAQDLAFQLEALQQTSISGLERAADSLPTVRRRPKWAWLIAAALGGLVVGALATKYLAISPPPPTPTFQRLTFRRGLVWSARFAADGQNIIYGGAWDGKPSELFSTSPDSPESRPLNLGAADLLSISRTGEMAISLDRRFVVGWETRGTLARVPLDGSAPRELLVDVQEADWGPDGESMAVVREVEGRVRLEYPVGTILYDANGWISLPRVHPQGDRVAFMAHPIRGDNVGAVRIVDLEGTVTEFDSGVQGLAWTPDGKEIWGSRGNTILAFSTPGAERVVYTGTGSLWLQDIAPDGRVLMALINIRRELVGRGPDSGGEQNLSWFDWSQARDISSDGRYALFGEGNRFGPDGYWLYQRATDGSPAVRIGEGLALAFSPDASWVLALSRPFSDAIPVLFPTGAGEVREVIIEGIQVQPWATFLPDGSSFLIAGTQPNRGTQIFEVGLEGGVAKPVTPEGIGFGYRSGGISPDGESLAAIGPDRAVHIYPLTGEEPRRVPETGAGDVPVQWSEDGRYLYVFQTSELPTRVDRIDLESGTRELLREITPGDPAGVFNIDMLHMTRNGEYYAYSYRRLLSTLYLVDGLR